MHVDKIVGVTFNNDAKIEYYYTNLEFIKKNTTVVVENDGVKRFAKVVTSIHDIDSSKLTKCLGNIVRISTKNDYIKNKENISKAKQALKKCRSIVEKKDLQMQIIDAYFTLDQDQLIFVFCADERVDFRDLAKELASIYKTRIELRQIGVRDKSKKVGGIGLCGQKLCCSRYIDEFDSVSIAMAKNQNLSLNPTKINGLCGRLLCCLKYENECYTEARKQVPSVGETVKTEYGEGKVVSVDILKKHYKVDIKEKGIMEIDAN